MTTRRIIGILTDAPEPEVIRSLQESGYATVTTGNNYAEAEALLRFVKPDAFLIDDETGRPHAGHLPISGNDVFFIRGGITNYGRMRAGTHADAVRELFGDRS